MFMNPEDFLRTLKEVVREAVREELSKPQDRLLTVKETCELLKISSRTLNRMTKSGEIRATVLKSRPAYQESEIQKIILMKRR